MLVTKMSQRAPLLVRKAGSTLSRTKKLSIRTQQHAKKANCLGRLKVWPELTGPKLPKKPAAGAAGFSFKGMLSHM